LDFSWILQLGPFGGQEGGIFQNILTIAFYGFFFAYLLFGQQIQSRLYLVQIDGALRRLEYLRNEARNLAVKTVKEVGKPKDDPLPSVNSLLEQFVIPPVDIDPAGIIPKIEHLYDIREVKLKDDVRRISPEAAEHQIASLANLVEATSYLNLIYKIVRHLYLLGKKTSSFFLIMQLQMFLPLIMQEADALSGATKAFAAAQPVGDGIGSFIAAKLMRDREMRKIEKDVVVAETVIEGRKVFALKAEGPGGEVGKPGEAIKKLMEENEGKIAMIVMIDAALKLEGEKTGEISEGIGAAIGGIGTERFKIEEVATKQRIPVHALIIKQSIQEAITPMKKDIVDAAEPAIERLKRIIVERTKEGDTVIVAGIGNTIGIAQ
jgi:hypothetical protein